MFFAIVPQIVVASHDHACPYDSGANVVRSVVGPIRGRYVARNDFFLGVDLVGEFLCPTRRCRARNGDVDLDRNGHPSHRVRRLRYPGCHVLFRKERGKRPLVRSVVLHLCRPVWNLSLFLSTLGNLVGSQPERKKSNGIGIEVVVV